MQLSGCYLAISRKACKTEESFRYPLKNISMVVLVGRMDGIRLKTKPHENGFQPQLLLKGADNGNAASTTVGYGFLAKGLFHGFARRLIGRGVCGSHVTLTTMQGRNFYLNVGGSNGFEMLLEELGNLVVVLVGHQSHGYFGRCLDGNTVLAPSPI